MIKRAMFFFIGLLIVTLGVGLIIQAGLGASAWDALAVGESSVFSLSVGTCVVINGVVLIFVNAFLMKKRPDILAGATIFLIGLLIDLWLAMLANLQPQIIWFKLFILLIGVLILGLGVSIYLQAKFPSSPMDTLMLAIHHRFNISLRYARILSEGSALFLAFLVKGPIGLGTIIVTLFLGFIVQFFYPKFEKLINNEPSV